MPRSYAWASYCGTSVKQYTFFLTSSVVTFFYLFFFYSLLASIDCTVVPTATKIEVAHERCTLNRGSALYLTVYFTCCYIHLFSFHLFLYLNSQSFKNGSLQWIKIEILIEECLVSWYLPALSWIHPVDAIIQARPTNPSKTVTFDWDWDPK